MVVCTFFQQGRCKFGDRCKYEHPGQPTAASSGNRFGALSGSLGSRVSAPGQQTTDYGVTANDIKLDLTAGKGRPEWIFSAYAPQRNVPRQLFGGPQRERSMEEMRLRHYEAAATGNMNVAVQEAQALWEESMKQIEVTLNDLNGAVKYIIDGANEHPNRIDITEGKTGPEAPSAFSQPSAFAQPSSAGPTSGGFGGASAGLPQPAGPGQPSAFAQPSAIGQQPGFGQPSFGQPSGLGTGSAFGKPSGLGGQPAFGKPAFGQPQTTQPSFGASGFGQPSAPGPSPFGAPSTTSPFTQISQNQPAPGGFGQPSAQPAPSPFGQQPPQQPAAPSGFGQPSAPSGFGQPAEVTSPFGRIQQPQPQSQPQPTAFGQPPNAAGPFGAPAQQPAAVSGFGQPVAPQGVPVERRDVGPRAFIKIEDPNELNPLPQLQGDTLRDPASKRLTMWKGRPVKYINDWPCYLHPQDNKTWVRINFPDGPPDEASLRDSQAKPEEYTPEIEEMYLFFLEHGYFKDGLIPPVPPKREWISFDF